jgi:hypothetical protein
MGKRGEVMGNDDEREAAVSDTFEALGWNGKQRDFIVNLGHARFVLQDELGLQGQPVEFRYTLDEAKRDMLLANTRQDARHLLLNSARLMDASVGISRQLCLLTWIGVAGLMLLAAVVVKLYPQILSGLHLQ